MLWPHCNSKPASSSRPLNPPDVAATQAKGPRTGRLCNLILTVFDPRHEQWGDHFQLLGPKIEGKTAIGRATAWLLQMNAERRVELRAQLKVLGVW